MAAIARKVVIIGGGGNVPRRLTKILSPKHSITSVVRNLDHEEKIKAVGGTPHVLSLETASVADFTTLFEGKDVIYFSAGAGAREEQTKDVDYLGVVKVIDALEQVKSEPKPRFILVSSIDVRNPDRWPDHYTDADKYISERIRGIIPGGLPGVGVIGDYLNWKYQADLALIKRTAFKWTIVRPGGLTDEPATGKVDAGLTTITKFISRQDVAEALALLLDREDADGLALDLVAGETPIADALDTAIKNKDTALGLYP